MSIPLLCSFCHYIGHSVDNCRKAKVASEAENGNGAGDKKLADHARKKKKWVEKEGEKQQPNRIVPIVTVIEKIHPHQDNLEKSNTFATLQDSVEDSISETQLAAGDLLNIVTGSSDAAHSTAQVSKDVTERLLTAAREFSMNRQLRFERDGLNAAPNDDADEVADSDSGEGIDLEQPLSTSPHSNAADRNSLTPSGSFSNPEKERHIESASQSGEETQDTRNSIDSDQKEDTTMTSPFTQSVAILQQSSTDLLPDGADMQDETSATSDSVKGGRGVLILLCRPVLVWRQ